MKVALIMVASLDGRITQGDKQGTHWQSPEDRAIFRSLLERHDRLVMGSTTYDVAKAAVKPDPEKLRVVLSRTPEKYAAERRPGLEFTAESPDEVIKRAAEAGCQNLALLGGATTNARFLDAELIDEIYVTIEPQIFGGGRPLTEVLRRTVKLQLISCQQLNSQGTLLVHYSVHKKSRE